MRPGTGIAVIVLLVAALATARAADLPRYGGMYPTAGGGSALAMLDSDIAVTVRGPIVEVVVTQKFQNKTDQPTEATYVFPLPADAAVSAMWIANGAKTIKASIEKRDNAQRRYEEAVRAGVKAAVLDQERPDVFTQTVSAIPAKGVVTVSLRYDSVARYRDGTWELVLPLVVAPRFVPGAATSRPTTGTGRAPDTDRAPDASRVTPAGAPGAGGRTDVKITFAERVDAVTSVSHDLKHAGTKPLVATLVDPKSDHDMLVRWKTPSTATGWVEAASDGSGFAAVVVEAPAAAPRKAGAMKWILALDRSAAARGDADAIAHPFVRQLAGAMLAGDRVMVTGSDSIAWSSAQDALRVLEDRWPYAAGAFDLTRVLGSLRADGAPVVLVTGGLVADDRAAIAAAKKVGVPIHVVGIGPAPARGLLAQIAYATGGTIRYAMPGDDLAVLARTTLADVAAPPAPLAITWGTLAASDVVPGVLPRLASGEAALVIAKVSKAQTANVRTRGDLFAIEALPPARAVDGATSALGPLARRWARNRLDELLDPATPAKPDVVAAHALQYGLVSPYTSMVAIGTEVVVQGGVKRSTTIPVSVPAGMKWQAVKQQQTEPVAVKDTPKPTTIVGGVKKPPEPKPEPVKADKPVAKLPANQPKQPVVPSGGTAGAPAAAKPSDMAPPPAAPPRDVRESADEEEDRGEAKATASSDDDVLDSGGMAPPEAAESIVMTGSYASSRSQLRFTPSFGAGLTRFAGDSSALLAFGGRVEYGKLTMFGLDSALWFSSSDGLDVQGRLMLSLARRGIARFVELGIAGGLHLGDASGPAAAASLRLHLPPTGRAAIYLRYDGALLRDATETRAGQHTLTGGLEFSF